MDPPIWFAGGSELGVKCNADRWWLGGEDEQPALETSRQCRVHFSLIAYLRSIQAF
jgi:hypothetical protein